MIGEVPHGPRSLSLDTSAVDAIRQLALPIGDCQTPLIDGVNADGVLRRSNANILATIEEHVYDGAGHLAKRCRL